MFNDHTTLCTPLFSLYSYHKHSFSFDCRRFMAEEAKEVELVSSDGVSFQVTESAALQSETVKMMMSGPRAGQPIPIPKVTAQVLAKVVDYLDKHAAAPAAPSVEEWDRRFVEAADKDFLFDLVLAANFLEIKSLLDLSCSKVAEMINGMPPEEIRKFFNIKGEYLVEDEEEVGKEN